jgi:hypothetical protein
VILTKIKIFKNSEYLTAKIIAEADRWEKKGSKPDSPLVKKNEKVYEKAGLDVIGGYFDNYTVPQLKAAVNDWRGPNSEETMKKILALKLSKVQLINALILTGIQKLPWNDRTEAWIKNEGEKSSSNSEYKFPKGIVSEDKLT